MTATVNRASPVAYSCRSLRGVGQQTEKRLADAGILSPHDLLFHLPNHYQDRTHVTPISDITQNGFYVIQGIVQSETILFGKRSSLSVLLADESGEVTLRFFQFNHHQRQRFQVGTVCLCFGEATLSYQQITLFHPEVQIIDEQHPVSLPTTLTPVYPALAGLGQTKIRDLISQSLQCYKHIPHVLDLLPEAILEEYCCGSLFEALKHLHMPESTISKNALLSMQHEVRARLSLEELMAHQLRLRQSRYHYQAYRALACLGSSAIQERLLQSLPFDLTTAQQRVLVDIEKDLASEQPMLRLLQGDVGSGKTIVCALAALRVVASGYQVALMAPTDLLAQQHFQNFKGWLKPLGVRVALLSSQLKSSEQTHVQTQAAQGELDVIVGTHALFQAKSEFDRLVLVIIDEQHRFGVKQRLALSNKSVGESQRVHQLLMSATPIPRSLAMTVFADLDLSVIDELPPGRQTIETVVIANHKRHKVMSRIQDMCDRGHQVYWICPLINVSEVLNCQAVEEAAELLKQTLPSIKIATVHGRLNADDKQARMQAFERGEIQLLVATTVVEVGVDVSNATLIVIENAERMGLSQLHQLRGRVGRGSGKSFCVLMYQAPLTEVAAQRLEVIRTTIDGFEIAQNDMAMRGPGDLLGTQQSGYHCMQFADLVRDVDMIPTAQRMAETVLRQAPHIVEPMIQRWCSD